MYIVAINQIFRGDLFSGDLYQRMLKSIGNGGLNFFPWVERWLSQDKVFWKSCPIGSDRQD
jgi:hypothetical protein